METEQNHLLIVTRILPHHDKGGMQEVAWDLARELAKQGFKITIITTEISTKPERFFEDKVEVINLSGVTYKRYSLKWWKASKNYFLNNLKNDTDALISISSAGYSIAKEMKNKPKLIQIHGTSFGEIISKFRTGSLIEIIKSIKNFYWLIKEIFVYKHFHHLIPVGPSAYKDLINQYYSTFIDKRKVELILNGIDTNLFSPADNRKELKQKSQLIERGDKTFITVSRLNAQKGIKRAIDLFSEYHSYNKSTKYIIIGDGPERKTLNEKVKKLNLENEVFFLGALDREDIVKYLQISDLFLFPTLRNEVGIPLNILEALAIGLPVVTSKHLDGLNQFEGVFILNGVGNSFFNFVEDITKNANYLKPKLPEKYTLNFSIRKYSELIKKIG